MVTKPVESFYTKRLPLYVHFYPKDYVPIEELAKKMNLPPHFILMGRSVFIDAHPGIKEEFEKWAKENEAEIRSRCMKPEDYNKWSAKHSNTGPLYGRANVVNKSSPAPMRCPVCRAPCTPLHIEKVHPDYLKKMKQEHPLEVVIRN